MADIATPRARRGRGVARRRARSRARPRRDARPRRRDARRRGPADRARGLRVPDGLRTFAAAVLWNRLEPHQRRLLRRRAAEAEDVPAADASASSRGSIRSSRSPTTSRRSILCEAAGCTKDALGDRARRVSRTTRTARSLHASYAQLLLTRGRTCRRRAARGGPARWPTEWASDGGRVSACSAPVAVDLPARPARAEKAALVEAERARLRRRVADRSSTRTTDAVTTRLARCSPPTSTTRTSQAIDLDDLRRAA